MAWRNLFRNRRRTFLTAAIIAIGLAGLIFTDAIIQGMVSNMVSNATDTFMGHAQVHAERFSLEGKVDQTVVNLPGIESLLRADPSVSEFSERTRAMAMVTSASDAESVMLYGIDPLKEKQVSQIHLILQDGRNLKDSREPGVLLGARLARTLQAKVGDRVVMTCAKAGTGELSQEMLRVVGVFAFHSDEMDRNIAFVGLKRSQKLMGLGPRVHEVVVRFKKGNGSEPGHSALYQALNVGGNETLPWSLLLPNLKVVIDISVYAAFILVFLLAILVALAILNTQFMALYERMFEFGVLRALGTHPMGLAGMVVGEAGCLGFLGVALGVVLGWAVTWIMAQIGIHYTGVEYAGLTFQHDIYPQARMIQYTLMPLGVWVFTVLIACYPASHAYRIRPAKAMHRSLG